MPAWSDLTPYLRWGAIVLFALVAAAIIASILSFGRARRAPYYFLRETARRTGLRWLLLGAIALVMGMWLLYLRGHPPGALPGATTASVLPPATLTATATSRPATATARPLPTVIPSSTPTPRPTPTAPLSPTPTPFYPLPETALSPLPGAVPASEEARISLVTFALGERNGRPVEPGASFPEGDYRVYLFFEYRGMDRGVTWTYAWYGEGEYLDGNTCLWGVSREDCPRVGGRAGSTYLYYRQPGGYTPGRYEVRVWIEDRLQAVAQFLITRSP